MWTCPVCGYGNKRKMCFRCFSPQPREPENPGNRPGRWSLPSAIAPMPVKFSQTTPIRGTPAPRHKHTTPDLLRQYARTGRPDGGSHDPASHSPSGRRGRPNRGPSDNRHSPHRSPPQYNSPAPQQVMTQDVSLLAAKILSAAARNDVGRGAQHQHQHQRQHQRQRHGRRGSPARVSPDPAAFAVRNDGRDGSRARGRGGDSSNPNKLRIDFTISPLPISTENRASMNLAVVCPTHLPFVAALTHPCCGFVAYDMTGSLKDLFSRLKEAVNGGNADGIAFVGTGGEAFAEEPDFQAGRLLSMLAGGQLQGDNELMQFFTDVGGLLKRRFPQPSGRLNFLCCDLNHMPHGPFIVNQVEALAGCQVKCHTTFEVLRSGTEKDPMSLPSESCFPYFDSLRLFQAASKHLQGSQPSRRQR